MTITSIAFTLICCIMQGFHIETIKKLQSIHPQIIMHASGQPIAYDAIESIITTEFKDSVAFISPIAQQHIIIPCEQTNAPLVMIQQTIDPAKERKLGGIMDTIVTSDKHALFSSDSVVIGKKCAELLGKKIGDQIDFLVAKDIRMKTRSLEFQPMNARITGFFSTGIEEYDMAFMLCSFDFLSTHFADAQITQCHMQAQPHQDIHQLTKKLSHRFKMTAMSWQELYPALLSTLTLQTWVTFFILAIVLLIAGTNLMSLLTMYAFYKRKERALLVLLRARAKDLFITFFLIGLFIGGFAVGLGTLLGTLCAWLLHSTIHIQLPDMYYVTHLPVNISLPTIMLCWACSMLIVLMLSGFSAYRSATFQVGTLLKGE